MVFTLISTLLELYCYVFPFTYLIFTFFMCKITVSFFFKMQIENKKMLASKDAMFIMAEDSNLPNLTLECNEVLFEEQNCFDVNKRLVLVIFAIFYLYT